MSFAELRRNQQIRKGIELPLHEQEASYDERIYKLKSSFEKQSQFPPGGDTRYTTPAFKAAMRSNDLLDLGIECQDLRRDRSPVAYRYLSQLLGMHAVNYVMIFEENEPDYPAKFELTSEDAWKSFYKYVLENHRESIKENVINRDIQTTRPNRGVAIPFIMSRMQNLHGHKPIRGVDLGCSTNVIWSHLAKHGQFNIEKDSTFSGQLGKSVIQAAAAEELDIGEIVGVDRANPLYDEGLLNWLLANRHFDEVTSEQIQKTKNVLVNYKNGLPNVSYQQGDLFNNSNLPTGVDVVTAFTLLSQMPDDVAATGIEVARSLLNERGILILQDYVRETDSLSYPEDREFYTYNTFVTGPGLGSEYEDQFLHITSFRDTRCTKMRNGNGLDQFISLTQ